MKFSYNAVWDDTLAQLRAHLPLIAAIAGVFIFLPSLLVDYAFPVPQNSSSDPQVQMDAISAYFQTTWPWQLLALVFTMIGILAILILILDRTRPTVGSAIASALKTLPVYILTIFIVAAALTFTAIVVLIPFLIMAAAGATIVMPLSVIVMLVLVGYVVWGRLALLPSVIAIDHRMPIGAIRRSLELTKGHGWAIFGLLLLIILASGIASLALGFVLGSLLLLLLGEGLGGFLAMVIGAAFNAAWGAFLVLTTASIYRTLSGSESTASLFE